MYTMVCRWIHSFYGWKGFAILLIFCKTNWYINFVGVTSTYFENSLCCSLMWTSFIVFWSQISKYQQFWVSFQNVWVVENALGYWVKPSSYYCLKYHFFCYQNSGRKCINENMSMVTVLGLILGLRPANERLYYFVTTSLIGWTQA